MRLVSRLSVSREVEPQSVEFQSLFKCCFSSYRKKQFISNPFYPCKASCTYR